MRIYIEREYNLIIYFYKKIQIFKFYKFLYKKFQNIKEILFSVYLKQSVNLKKMQHLCTFLYIKKLKSEKNEDCIFFL